MSLPQTNGANGANGASEASAALAAAWLASGEPAWVVQVLGARGSVPRGNGTRMLVAAGAVAGTVGGGHLEFKAIELARQRLREAAFAPQNLGHAASATNAAWDWPLALGPSLGQCCGGALTLRFEPLSAQVVQAWPAAAPLFKLHLFGAGHVGRAIVQVLAGVPCEVCWVDEREAEFPRQPLPAHIHPVCVDAVVAEVGAAQPGDFFLVLTHSHALDEQLTEAILRRADFGWFGLIGSASKRARFEHRLHARGLAHALTQRICCPIGLPGIPGKEPGVIAVAVAAQLLQQAALKTA